MTHHHSEDAIPTLSAALSEYMNDELKKLARLIGTRVPSRKAEIVDHIVAYLEGEKLRHVWQGLDELQRAAVAEVVHSGDTVFDAQRFEAKYGRAPAWGSMDPDRDEEPTTLRFFFYADDIMPDDIKDRLASFVPRPARVEVQSTEQLPRAHHRRFERWNDQTRQMEEGTETILLAICETERTAQQELLGVLRLVDAGQIRVSDKTRKPTAATVKAVSELLVGGDYYPHEPPRDKYHDDNPGPMRAFAWPMIVQAGKLVQLSGKRLQLTRSGRKALTAPAVDTIRALWSRWVDTTILDELSRIDCVKGQTGKGKRGLTAVSGRRTAVRTTLGGCPQDRWIAVDELLRFMRAQGDDFAVTRDAWDLYIGDPQSGSLGYEGGESILEDRYTLCLLLEYAATLGLLDVALIPPAGARDDYDDLWGTDDLPYFSRYDGLMYLRINALGAYCLDMATTYTPAAVEVKSVLRVLPNLRISVLGDSIEDADRLALDAYAISISDSGWKLDLGKLLSAMDQGRSVAEIRAFLEARSGAPLPQTAIELLEDTAERSTRVRDRGMARLVECDEASLATLIASDPKTRKHCMRAGERHLVVPMASEAAFKRNLRDLGYLLGATGGGSERVKEMPHG